MMSDLKYDLSQCMRKGTLDPISPAGDSHQVFVNIHPSIDGDGRMCSIMLDGMPLKVGDFLVCIGGGEKTVL